METNTCQLSRDENGSLWLEREGGPVAVRSRLCFPWSSGTKFISLRDEKEQELHFVQDIEALDPASREALTLAMTEAGFVMEITGIRAIREEFELRVWDVETRSGRRAFQTKLDDWPRSLPGGGLLVRDVAGDLFHISNPDALDAPGRLLLSAFVD